MTILIILLILVIIFIVPCIKVVPQAKSYVIERLGSYYETWNNGLHILIPFLDRVRQVVTLKEIVKDFPPQPVITKDNVTMQIDTVVYFQITDAKLFTYGVDNPISAIENLTATTLRNLIGELELDQTLTSRDIINSKMRSILDEATDPWGIKINRVEVKNIIPPRDIQEAMEKQMRAERERREKILQAEGEKKSSILIAEGEKESAILRAEADKEAKIKMAEGEAEALLKIHFPFEPDDNTVLENMIYEGLIAYLAETIIPDYEDSLYFSFSSKQLSWCIAHERQIWEQLLIDDILYSTSGFVKSALLKPAPFSEHLTRESPGQTCCWIGKSIVESYLSNNKAELKYLLETKAYQDSQTFLIDSKYDGRK